MKKKSRTPTETSTSEWWSPVTGANHPERIGPFKIRQVLGEGGMGIVYEAEQTAPVRRRVALKVIKAGMDTKEVVARFEAERQALAVMDHPNIAKVLDAGATETGRPYFVMELVYGVNVTAASMKTPRPPIAGRSPCVSVCWTPRPLKSPTRSTTTRRSFGRWGASPKRSGWRRAPLP